MVIAMQLSSKKYQAFFVHTLCEPLTRKQTTSLSNKDLHVDECCRILSQNDLRGLKCIFIWKLKPGPRSGPEVIKLFPCSTQLSTKFQLLLKTKIPTNEEVACFKSLRYCIYHANKC